jgi:ATP-dependent DNA ligase
VDQATACKLVDKALQGREWLHEIKYDGYRMHARLDRGRAQSLTRTGLDWTHKYPAKAAAVSALPARQAYLDGELCGVRHDGKTSFSMIQTASDAGIADALVFFLFDLLYLDGDTIEVKYLTWTGDNLLRRVVYQGLRQDKNPQEGRRDVPTALSPTASAPKESGSVRRKRGQQLPPN